MKATLKNFRQSPRKVRIIANAIRGRKVKTAISILNTSDKKASVAFKKLIDSAVSNSKDKKEDLVIKSVTVDEAVKYKRYRPRAMGRIHPILKRGSTINLHLK